MYNIYMDSKQGQDEKTREVDEVIQPYYQKARLSYEKGVNKRHVPWDLLFLIFAIALVAYYFFFD